MTALHLHCSGLTELPLTQEDLNKFDDWVRTSPRCWSCGVYRTLYLSKQVQRRLISELTLGLWVTEGGGVTLGATFCWEILGSATSMDDSLTMCPSIKHKWSRNVSRSTKTSFSCWYGLQIPPDLSPNKHLQDLLDKQVWSSEASPRDLLVLKAVLQTSRCLIPQHSFRGLERTPPAWVRAVLEAEQRFWTGVCLFLWHISLLPCCHCQKNKMLNYRNIIFCPSV